MKQKDIFSRTRKNIIFISIDIVLACLIIFALITAMLYRARLFINVDQQIQTQKNMVLTTPSLIKNKDGEKKVVMPAPLATDLLSFVWQDDVIVDQSPHTYEGENSYPIFPEGVDEEIILLKDGEHSYRAVQFEKEGFTVQLLMNVDGELNSLKELEKALCLAFLFLMLVSLGLASYLASVVLKPLKVTYDKQIAFIQDASHEMRTPLAIIKGRLELLAKNRGETIEAHFEEISGIMGEIRGLEKLNSDLLLMSKEDVGGSLQVTNFSLNAFIEEIYTFYSDFAEIQDKVFILEELIEDLEVAWDRVKTKRCICILLDNAFKYTKAQDEITLAVKRMDKGIRIVVSDTGIGIKEEDQSRIFDRFFRSNEVRASGIEGSGIGLSLLKSLAYTMGIKISVVSEYNKGTNFSFDLPLKM